MNPTSKPPLGGFEQRLLGELREFVELRAAAQTHSQDRVPPVTSRRPRGDQSGPFWRRRWTRPTVMLAVACVAAAVAVVVGNGSSSPPSAAAAVLHRLARVAAARPVIQPGPGQYLHLAAIRDGETVQGNCTVLVPDHVQSWISANGSALVLQKAGQLAFPSAHNKRACERAHSPLLHGGITDITGMNGTSPDSAETWWAPGCYGLEGASRLQASLQDPRTLLRRVRVITGVAVPGPAGAFISVGDLLAENDALPALRAALYRAAATIPGVRLLGPVIDRLGRHGIGLALTSHDASYPGWTFELIFDAHDSALLGDRRVDNTGQLNGWDVYHKPTIVNQIPARPPSRLSPPCTNGQSSGHPTPAGIMIMTGAAH
ncbi:MAG: CU044_5270 family protein [Solirubrobacteraceae bacterium]